MTEPREDFSYGSGAWWRARSDDELQTAIDGNVPGSRAHDGPMLELQRRKAERAQAKQLFWIRLTFTVSLLGAAVAGASLL